MSLALTSTLPLNAIAFLIYNHGSGVLNLIAQGSDLIWMGGADAVPMVVLQHGEAALCLSRVNGEYDVIVTPRLSRFRPQRPRRWAASSPVPAPRSPR